VDDIAIAIAQAGLNDARRKGFEDGVRAAANWLRRNAKAEQEPAARKALLMAYNAVRQIRSR